MGDPRSPADLFRPTALDTDQWAAAAQSANMSWGCLTTRHHDGFCIWPTKSAAANMGQTLHSTDIVRAYVGNSEVKQRACDCEIRVRRCSSAS
jgi:alpha-L-fucosidase